jgi:hypothetical protein
MSKITLKGRITFIDQYGRLMCDTADRIPFEVYKTLKGISPVKPGGFLLNAKKAKIFAPQLSDDPRLLVGKDVTAECYIKTYTLKDKSPGWQIVAVEISTN